MLEAAVAQTRRLMAPGALEQACTTPQEVTPDASAPAWSRLAEQAYTTQAGAGLIAIDLKTGRVAYQSPSFQDLTSWIPAEMRGNIRVSLQSGDGEYFHRFCQLVVRDAGEPYGETFLGRDNVVGRSLTVRFFTRVPGPTGLRNPEWLLMVRQVKLTLVGVQHQQPAGESTAAGTKLPFFGLRAIPQAIGVFTADLSGCTPSQWTVQAAHVRNLLDLEVASGTYDMKAGDMKPLESLSRAFSFEFSKAEGAGASLFSRAAAQLEYAATGALNIAQRSASWLTRKALRFTDQWTTRLRDDDTVTISHRAFFTLFGGLSTSLSVEFVGGKVGFSHGGLEFLYFVADPEQPLDGNLRATIVRISAAKTAGEFDVNRPLVFSCKWGHGDFTFCCKMLSLDTVGTKMAPVEDVSQLLEKLRVSPGGGHLSDGSLSFCIGQSHV